MINLDQIKRVHFIGIGGIGMSALARYFNGLGKNVSGYDKVRTTLTNTLEAEGMQVYYTEQTDQIPESIRRSPSNSENLIIYTPAIPKKHAELTYFREKEVRIYKRAEVLGIISKHYPTIAVAGTHGKTSTTAMLAYILSEGKKPFAGFIGGICSNFNSNFILKGKPELLLTEADEYDRSFLNLRPNYAVVTSMDADHLDIYGESGEMEKTYRMFCEQVAEDGLLMVHYSLRDKLNGLNFKTYGHPDADYFTTNVHIEGRLTRFDFANEGRLMKDLELKVPGSHNLLNATAAIGIALAAGVSEEEIRAALPDYLGVKRRFEYHIDREDLIYIDDYAHHPQEIRALVSSVRQMYPGRKITGVFQPHLFSRTRDFAEGFAESLSMLDEVILLEIYPAREEPIAGISSAWLLEQIAAKSKLLSSKETLISDLDKSSPELLLTIGAGDIDQLIEPIKKHFHD